MHIPSRFALDYSSFAFTGTRFAPPEYHSCIREFISILSPRQRVFVGCARGVDDFVLRYCHWATVFRVSSGQWGSGVAAYARRSVAMLDALQAAVSPQLLIALPLASPPPGLKPSKHWISASGSGTWGTVAVAVGRRLPCLLYSAKPPVGWGFEPVAPHWWLAFGDSAVQLTLF